MPHLFLNRPRLYHPTLDRLSLIAHFRWETLNAIIYLIGGVLFIAGSIFFFPVYDRYVDIGAYTFVFGSLLYLIVTGHDMIEIRRNMIVGTHHTDFLELTAAATYLCGTLLFTAGSIFFLSTVGLVKAGIWCFIIGSLLFVLGASVNVLQIIKARSLQILQLMNLTAVSFVVGSVLFAAASVPFLWEIATQPDRTTLFNYVAWEYVIGSFLFFTGGVFNYFRARLVWHEEIQGSRAENAG